MVGLVVVSHSAQLAAGVVELAREMAGEVRLEAAGGLEPPADGAASGDAAAGGEAPSAPLGTDATRVMAAIEAADDGSGDGVVVLMDLGSAILSAEMALELMDPEIGERVVLCAAPLVEGAVAAAVSAQAGGDAAAVVAEATGALAPKQSHLGSGEPAGASDASGQPDARSSEGHMDPQTTAHPADVVEERFRVTVSQGLHARPAAQFVRTAAAIDAQIEVENATTGAGPAPATSLNGLATLGVREGHDILVRAVGAAAHEAIEALRAVATGAADAPSAPPPGPSPAPPPQPPSAETPPATTEPAAPGPGQPGRQPPPDSPPGTLAGIPTSPGIAIAPLRRLGAEASDAEPPIPDAPSGEPSHEWAKLGRARTTVREEAERSRDRVAAQVGAEEAEILDALALMLDDDALLAPARAAIERDRRSAARAWADAVAQVVARYEALDDPYQRERAADVADLGRRVLKALAADPHAESDQPQPAGVHAEDAQPAILLARDLTPLDAAQIDPATTRGIATARGGPTSHGAILARALGIPAVVGLGNDALDVEPGTTAILDGTAGLLIPDPPPAAKSDYAERRAREAAAAEQARAAAHDPAFTRDGTLIEVAANAGDAEDAKAAASAGADGVGLLRTEFAFLGRAQMPDEREQAEIYGAAAEALQGRPLVIRTLDAGADKPLPYLAMAQEENPFLGVRGLRLGLARPELLRTQLRAIIRTAAAHDNVKVMFPMVATVEELRAARRLLDEACAHVGDSPRDGFEVGIMVEVPAAALLAVQLAHHVDFFSLGTNDLTQYVLAAERGNAALASLADGLHPAVLRLVHEVCHAAQAHGRWVGVCGELAADPLAVPLLAGLGVRELSVAAPAVAAVKAAVRTLDLGDASALAHAALAADSATAVRELVVSDRGAPGTA
jgi:phosphocarrier protein FPr